MSSEFKIYLAGKILNRPNPDPNNEDWKLDWREDICRYLRNEKNTYLWTVPGNSEYSIPTIWPGVLLSGPIPSGEHGYFWAGEHGNNQGKSDIFAACFRSILESDVILAYIDQEDCFGTLVELGYAARAGKPVWVIFSNKELNNKMWFLAMLANSCGGVRIANDEPVKDVIWNILQTYYREEIITLMAYPDYLKTEHWKSISKIARDKAGYRCQICNSSDKTLHIHHRTYERRGCELVEDLICLCSDCHQTFHDKERAA